MASTKLQIENIAPILRIEDMERSLKFYTDVLGFTAADWGDQTFTNVALDNVGIYLCKGAQGSSGTWVWIGFDGDIFQLHQKLLSQNVKIKLPPTNFPWAFEMQVYDPDGHVLRFGTDPNPDLPFSQSF